MKDNEFKELENLLTHNYRVIGHLQGKHLVATGQRFIPAFIGKLDDAETKEVDAIIYGPDIPDCRVGCDSYSPERSPEIEIYYKAIDPDIGPEIYDITVNGKEVSDLVYNMIYDIDFESEIEAMLKKLSEEARKHKLIEAFQTRLIEGDI